MFLMFIISGRFPVAVEEPPAVELELVCTFFLSVQQGFDKQTTLYFFPGRYHIAVL